MLGLQLPQSSCRGHMPRAAAAAHAFTLRGPPALRAGRRDLASAAARWQQQHAEEAAASGTFHESFTLGWLNLVRCSGAAQQRLRAACLHTRLQLRCKARLRQHHLQTAILSPLQLMW